MANTATKIGKSYSRLAQAIKDKDSSLSAVFSKYGISFNDKNLGQSLKGAIQLIKSNPQFSTDLATAIVGYERSKTKSDSSSRLSKIASNAIKSVKSNPTNFIGSNADGQIDPEVSALATELKADAALITDSDIATIESGTTPSSNGIGKKILIVIAILIVLFLIYKFVLKK